MGQYSSRQIERWGEAIKERIADAIGLYGRLALPFSGGMESCLLLHLAEPHKDHIVVVVVDTGATFPHVAKFIGDALAGWNSRIVKSDVPAFLETALPTSIFALLEMLQSPISLGEIRSAGGKRIVPAFDCCSQHRGFAGSRAVKGLNIRAKISERIGGNWNDPPQSFEGVEQIAPLIGHTRDEILAMIAAFNIAVPDNYPDFDAPHGCSICPAALTPQRQMWMARLYPNELATAGALNLEETLAVQEAIATGKILQFNEAAGSA